MERRHLRQERKNMDTCLRRLKQELLSMKEAGDGLQAQMTSMMGALQELRLLQVQTALEELMIAGPLGQANPPDAPGHFSSRSEKLCLSHVQVPGRDSGLDVRSSSSSSKSSSFLPPRWISREWDPLLKDSCDSLSNPPALASGRTPQTSDLVELPGIQRCQSPDSEFSQESTDDSSSWSSTLMSHGRNRQPLVLGDNIFADLVGNWLDLPELETALPTEGQAHEPAHPLQPSCSGGISRKFSLSTSIFKKFLRSVRPDKDKLLQEKPGWMPLDGPGTELLKRHKKVSKPKGIFYLPFWTRGGGHQGQSRLDLHPPKERSQSSGIYTRRRQPRAVDDAPAVFDYSTAVWV